MSYVSGQGLVIVGLCVLLLLQSPTRLPLGHRFILLQAPAIKSEQ